MMIRIDMIFRRNFIKIFIKGRINMTIKLKKIVNIANLHMIKIFINNKIKWIRVLNQQHGLFQTIKNVTTILLIASLRTMKSMAWIKDIFTLVILKSHRVPVVLVINWIKIYQEATVTYITMITS